MHETRARDTLAAKRRAQAAPVRVEQLTPISASTSGRFDIPRTWTGFDVVLKVAGVLADPESPETGLVLGGQPILVTHQTLVPQRAQSSRILPPLPRRTVWGSNETFKAMTQDDWRFAVTVATGVPVPAFVSSQPRALAYYFELDLPLDQRGVDALRRWGRAIKQVFEAAEVMDGLFGSGKPAVGVDDLTFEQALATKDPALCRAWGARARTVASAAKKAHRYSSSQWMKARRDEAS